VRPVEERAAAAYLQQFGKAPEIVASAPGRVNLIGEHTDYNGGFVLPCAIDRRVAVAVGRAPDGKSALFSADLVELAALAAAREGAWADYPRGVFSILKAAGVPLSPVYMAFAGDVPMGAGLSSSAAIEAATALALTTLAHGDVPRAQLARLCQRAENEFVGVSSGIMDQYAALLCQANHALFLDCRSLAAEAIPLDLDAAKLALVVCDTQVRRALRDTAYNARREACARAAQMLEVPLLRDAQASDLARLSGEELKRARHVISENGRVLAAVASLRQQDFAAFGGLWYVSHHSLKDDYEVSIPTLDSFVETAQQVGALGARLTGAGFGGGAIALIAAEDVERLREAVNERFAAQGFMAPAWYVVRPSAGAEVVA
jgi:galactokinase